MSLGGIIGPPIIAGLIGGDKNYTLGYTVIGIIALAALILPLITKMPKATRESGATAVEERRADPEATGEAAVL